MTLKVLPLAYWMELHVNFPDIAQDELPEIAPILNRDGYFYETVSKRCWFEFNGRAFDLEKNTQFLFELELLNHKPLSTEEINAFKVLTKHKLISKDQCRLLWIDSFVKGIRLDALESKKFYKELHYDNCC
jgi:hypothetical protein